MQNENFKPRSVCFNTPHKFTTNGFKIIGIESVTFKRDCPLCGAGYALVADEAGVLESPRLCPNCGCDLLNQELKKKK